MQSGEGSATPVRYHNVRGDQMIFHSCIYVQLYQPLVLVKLGGNHC